MPDEPIRDRIAALQARTPAQTVALTSQVVRSCVQDSWRPGALEWLRRRRPDRSTIAVTVECTCASGRCDVCN